MALTVNYDPSVTNRQRQLVQDALAAAHVPWNYTVTVKTVAEPSAPGHKDYMATTSDGLTIEIRAGVDDPASPANSGLDATDARHFFLEAVIHEVVHVAAAHRLTTNADKAEVAALFHRTPDSGAGPLNGVLADWNPLDKPWSDRVQEAVAEVLKDALLPDALRVFDNRTNWTLDKSKYQLLLTKLGATSAAGSFTRYSASPFPPIADITFEGVTYSEINTTVRGVVIPGDPTDIPQGWNGLPPVPEPFTEAGGGMMAS